VICLPTQRRALYVFAAIFLATVSVSAQTSIPSSAPAIPMREEGHHHLIFQNSYVNVFFVEIPPHETTLPHHHDLPYISVPPGGPDAPPYDNVVTQKRPEVGYSAGNFSHAVTNSSDVTLRNIAVELLHPQGSFRNGCAAIMRDQLPGVCDAPGVAQDRANYRAADFESDEIVVESWYFDRAGTAGPFDDPRDMLIAGLNGVSVSGASGLDSANALRGGILWVPAGSKPVFRTSAQHDGHFIAIIFKDSARPPR
jgi:hypothetical protein